MEPLESGCGNELVRFENHILIEKQLKPALPLLIQFCQSFNEVFNNGSLIESQSTDDTEKDQLISWCIQKFRQVYRKQYRGMTYLSSAALRAVQEKALNEAMKILQITKENDKKAEIENELEIHLFLETFWIEKANELRREAVLSQMKQDACMEFISISKRQFPALSVIDSMEFYEGSQMSTKLEEMRNDFILNFKTEIPFVKNEDPEIVSTVSDEMETILDEKVINVLVDKNSNRKETVEDLMTNILKESVDKFTNKLMEATDGKFVFNDPDKVLEITSKLRNQFRPVFIGFGHEKCRKTFLESYKSSTFEVLKYVLNSQNAICQNKLEDTSAESCAKMDTFFEEISQVFQKNGIPRESLDNVQKTAQEKMDGAICSLKKSNQKNLEFILNTANNDDYLIEKRGEKIYQIMTHLKSEYVEQLNARMKVLPQKDKLEEKDHQDLRQFHKEKKTEMCKLLEMDFRRKFGANEESIQKHQNVLINFADAVFHSIAGVELIKAFIDGTIRLAPDAPIRNDIIIRKTEIEAFPSDHINSVPTLTIQLTPVSIRMAMMINGKPEIIENQFGQAFTHQKVGFTKENKFIYGSELSHQSRLKSLNSDDCILNASWSLFSSRCAKTSWRQKFYGKEKEYNITYEFLLGFLLKKLRESAEKKIGQVITTTALTVPFWFGSAERIRVKDAAALAGFKNVTLVNDGTAAAWYCFNSIAPKHGDKIMVFSHNGLQSYHIFLYEVILADQKELQMLAYKKLKPSGNEGDQNYLENGVTDVCEAYKEITKDKIKAGETVFIQMACDLNKSRSAIQKTATKRIIGAQVAFTNGDEAIVKGGALIGHALSEIGIPVRDKLCFDLFQTDSIGDAKDQEFFLESGQFQPKFGCKETVSATIYMLEVPEKRSFFQNGIYGKKFIGELEVDEDSELEDDSVCDEIVAKFCINHEQIVVFEEAVAMKYGEPVDSENADEIDERIVWQSPNLSVHELDEQKNLLKSLSSN